MRKKILFIASVYRHLVAFHIPYIKQFQEQGYEVWASGNGEDGKGIIESLNVKCIDIPFSRNPFNTQNINAYQKLKHLFYKEKFELVHVHTPVASLLTRLAFKKAKYGKLVYTAHGFHFFEGAPKQNWIIYYSAEKLAAKWTDHLITINQEDYKNAKKLLPENKVSYVHGVGVELEPSDLSQIEKKNFRTELGLSQSSVVIAYVSELNANKNHQFLLRNWVTLSQQCPDLELLIIGTGENELELKEFVQVNELQKVHFLGYRLDVPNLLEIADIVTLLSYREGLPKSIMEAMVEGIPCVVTNTRGLRDLILDQQNGYVVNHNDDACLVESFKKLAMSEELRSEMGIKSKELVKPYLLENVLPEYIEVYEKLLNE